MSMVTPVTSDRDNLGMGENTPAAKINPLASVESFHISENDHDRASRDPIPSATIMYPLRHDHPNGSDEECNDSFVDDISHSLELRYLELNGAKLGKSLTKQEKQSSMDTADGAISRLYPPSMDSESQDDFGDPDPYHEEDVCAAEVRATVPNVDDPEMHFNTLRSWLLSSITGLSLSGLVWTLNTQTEYGNVKAVIGAVLCQPLVYAAGSLLASIPYPSHWPMALFINPGPFNLKEHAICTIVATVATGPNLTLHFLMHMLSLYEYHKNRQLDSISKDLPDAFPRGFLVLAYLSTPLVGFALGGFAGRFLVWPGKLIWPEQLQTAAMLTSLHGVRRSYWSRRKVIWTVMLVTFAYEWVPLMFFTPLAAFSWPTWLGPSSYPVNLLFGGTRGMGLSFVSLDWVTVIVGLGSPLYVPWRALVNVFVGFVAAGCVLPMILIFAKSNKASGIPYIGINPEGSSVWWVDGEVITSAFQVSEPLPQDMTLNTTVLRDADSTTGYLTPLETPCTAWAYAACTALLVHTALFHWKDLWSHWKLLSPGQSADPHTRQMGRYKQVPTIWYWALLLVSLGLAVAMVHSYRTSFPVWAILIAVLVAAAYVVPIGIIQGLTSVKLTCVEYLASLMVGVLRPGHTTAMPMFQLFSAATVEQALLFCGCSKLALYFKIPPRAFFVVIVASQVVCSLFQAGLWIQLGRTVAGVSNITNSWQVLRKAFTPGHYDPFFWVGVGPHRTGFVHNYTWVLCFFIIGAILPVPLYVISRNWPSTWVRFRLQTIHLPLFFGGVAGLSLYTPISWTSWFFYGACWHFLFMRPARHNYWLGLNYLVSAGLNVGISLCAAIIATMWIKYRYYYYYHAQSVHSDEEAPQPPGFIRFMNTTGSLSDFKSTLDEWGYGIVWRYQDGPHSGH